MWVRGSGVLVGGRVLDLGLRWPDSLPDSRCRDAGHDRARPSKGTDTAPTAHSHCVYYRECRRIGAVAVTEAGGGRMSVQAIQRGSAAVCARSCAESELRYPAMPYYPGKQSGAARAAAEQS